MTDSQILKAVKKLDQTSHKGKRYILVNPNQLMEIRGFNLIYTFRKWLKRQRGKR